MMKDLMEKIWLSVMAIGLIIIVLLSFAVYHERDICEPIGYDKLVYKAHFTFCEKEGELQLVTKHGSCLLDNCYVKKATLKGVVILED